MHRAQQIISAVNEIDVDYVCVRPTHWPGLNDYKPIAAILETGSSCDDDRPADLKGVLPAKISSKPIFRNATAFFCFPCCLLLMCGLLVLLVFLHSLLVVFFFVDLFVFLFLVYLFVFLLLRVGRFLVRSCALFLLRMGLVLRKDRRRNSKKYSQYSRAENCQ